MEEELYLCFAKQGQLYFTSQNAENVLCDEWDKSFAIPWACIVENGCDIVEKLFSNMTYEKVLNLFRFYEVKYQTYSL